MRRLCTLLLISLIACSDDGPGGDGDFSLRLCRAYGTTWVAQQDGDGPWQEVLPGSTGGGLARYDLTFTAARGGIAIIRTASPGNSLDITLGTPDELAEFFSTDNNPPTCSMRYFQASVTTPNGDDTGVIGVGGSNWRFNGDGMVQVQALAGRWPFLAAVSEDWWSDPTTASRFIVRNWVDVPEGGVLSPPLDFTSSEAFPAATARATITGPSLFLLESTFVHTGSGTRALIGSTRQPVRPGFIWSGIPADRLGTLRWQQLVLAVTTPDGARSTSVWFREVKDQELTFGPELNLPLVTFDPPGNTAGPRLQLAVQPEYDGMVTAEYSANYGPPVRLRATAAWFNHATTWDLVTPNLSGVHGWDDAWGFRFENYATWTVAAYGGDLPGTSRHTEGSTSRMAQRQGVTEGE